MYSDGYRLSEFGLSTSFCLLSLQQLCEAALQSLKHVCKANPDFLLLNRTVGLDAACRAAKAAKLGTRKQSTVAPGDIGLQ